MSLNGTSPPDFTNYSSSQLEKFADIMKAQRDSNIQLAATLIINLSPEDNLKFDEYIADWEKFYKLKKVAEQQLEYHQREIEPADQEFYINEERKEIIYQHSAEHIATMSNDHANDHSATSGRKKMKCASCTLL